MVPNEQNSIPSPQHIKLDDIIRSSIHCVGKIQLTNPSKYTTLIIMAYTNNDGLMMLLSEYNDCTTFGGILYEIIIVWNNPILKFNYNHPKLIINDHNHIIPITVIPQTNNSMSNRWFISRYHDFKTQSAIFIDDDIYMNRHSIQCLLSVFNSFPNRNRIIAPNKVDIMGRSTRTFEKHLIGNSYTFSYKNPRYFDVFHMLLPGMSLFNINYVSLLADKLEEYGIIDIIDNQIAHCDDIAVMLCYAMIMNGKPFLYAVDYVNIEDYSIYRGNQSALTNKLYLNSRYEQRTECLTMLMRRMIEINKQHNNSFIVPIVDHDANAYRTDCFSCVYCDKRACRKDQRIRRVWQKFKQIFRD